MLFACILLLNIGFVHAEENVTQKMNAPEALNQATDAVNSSHTTNDNLSVTNFETDNECEGSNGLQAAAGSSTINNTEIEDAAVRLDKFIKTNKRLPSYVTVSGKQLNPAEFLQLMTAYLTGKTLEPISVKLPSKSTGTSLKGSITRTDYIESAWRVYNFIESNSRAPNFARFHNQQIRFEFLVWLFARVITFKVANHRLPNYVNLENLNNIMPFSDNPTTSSDNSGTGRIGEGGDNSNGTVNNSGISVSDILSAAKKLKDFIQTNRRLPDHVTVSNQGLTVAQFFELMLNVIVQVNSDHAGLLTLKAVKEALNPSGSATGQIMKSEYIRMANKILDFIKVYGRAPNYVTTSIGRVSYPNLVYAMTRILTFYNDNSRLPNYVTIEDVNGLSRYLVATANCQVNDPSIRKLAAQLTAGLKSEWDKAKAVFEWVRDNISYSFYYNTRYGAVGTLKYRTGNCCDHAHLVVALARAASLPARYMHGICTFSSGTYGHVWAQIYINGAWYNADATSNRNSLGVINSWNTATAKILGTYASLPF